MNDFEQLVTGFFASVNSIAEESLREEHMREDYIDSLKDESISVCDWCGETIADNWYEIDTGKTVDRVCPECIEMCRRGTKNES